MDSTPDLTTSEMTSIDELFAGPAASFTDRRKALATTLKKAGRVAQADFVGRLKKPTVIAARVNGLVHRHREAIERLLKTSEALQSAQASIARGRAGGDFKRLMEEERKAVAALLDADSSLADPASRARVRATLLSLAHAALDRRALLRRGWVEAESRESGFGFGGEQAAGLIAEAPQAPPGAEAPAEEDAHAIAEERRQQQRRLTEARDRIRADVDNALKRAEGLESVAAAAEITAQAARKRAEAARADATRLQVDLAQAESTLRASVSSEAGVGGPTLPR
jgi:hypothetical protein